MKFPSLSSLSRNSVAVFKRFPTLFVVVAFATALAYFLMGEPPLGDGVEHQLWQLLATCDLLLTLGLAADLFAESRAFNGGRKWGFRAAVFVVCGLLYTVLDPAEYQTDMVRFGLFIFAFHHLVAFAPFIKRGSNSDFWNFNKVLFLRFLTAVLYSASLYAGLAVALFGVEELFNLDLPSETYGRLFVLVAIGFNTLFFLAGVPTVETTTAAESYPKGLKIFTQYVLIPLMTIYLAILLVYEVKIGVEWEMPKGIVATLILGYAVFGMLSLVLIWPIRNADGNRWVRLFSKSFYLTMIPLILLLALAVYQRVSYYGFTEERHILMALTVWLAAITVYFLYFRKDDIRVIPVSLALLALSITFGPQSATAISRHSQQQRLAELLSTTTEATTDERPNIITYLLEAHGLQSMQLFTETDLDSLDEEITTTNADLPPYRMTWLKRDTIFALLDVPPTGVADGRYLTIRREGAAVIPVRGYDYVYRIEPYGSDSTMIVIGKSSARISLERDSLLAVEVAMENDTTVCFDLKPLVEEIYQASKEGKLTPNENDGTGFLYPAEKMEIHQETTHFTITLLLDQVNGDFLAPLEESSRGIYAVGYLLFREK